MRIKIYLSENKTPVPVDNQVFVNSFIHKSLGSNEYHDKPSDYCISQLCGGTLNISTRTLDFKNGGFIIVSASDTGLITNLVNSIYGGNKDLGHGISVKHIEFLGETLYNGWNHFKTLSPILLKEIIDKGKYKFITVKDSDFNDKLSTRMKLILSKIDSKINLDNIEFKVHKNSKPKTVFSKYKNVINISSHCFVSVKCDKYVAQILTDIGFGNSTGSGFGLVFNVKDSKFYDWKNTYLG